MLEEVSVSQKNVWISICSKYGIPDNSFLFHDFLSYWNCFKKKNGKRPTMKDIKNQFLKGYNVCLEKSVN